MNKINVSSLKSLDSLKETVFFRNRWRDSSNKNPPDSWSACGSPFPTKWMPVRMTSPLLLVHALWTVPLCARISLLSALHLPDIPIHIPPGTNLTPANFYNPLITLPVLITIQYNCKSTMDKELMFTSSSRCHIQFTQILSCNSIPLAILVHLQVPFIKDIQWRIVSLSSKSQQTLVQMVFHRFRKSSPTSTHKITASRFSYHEFGKGNNLSVVTKSWWP